MMFAFKHLFPVFFFVNVVINIMVGCIVSCKKKAVVIYNLGVKPDLCMGTQTAVVSQRWRPQSQNVHMLTQSDGDDVGIVSPSLLMNGLFCQQGSAP